MKNKVKKELFKIIYNKLELNYIEQDFINNNVPSKEIVDFNNEEIISKYFFLLNDVYLERLNESELEFLNRCINSEKIEEKDELYTFLNNNMLKLLLPETDENYLYWGGISFQYMAPSDAIVIAFHTLDFQDENEEFRFKRNIYVNDKLNYIQTGLSQKHNLKVAIIKYNEIAFDKVRII